MPMPDEVALNTWLVAANPDLTAMVGFGPSDHHDVLETLASTMGQRVEAVVALAAGQPVTVPAGPVANGPPEAALVTAIGQLRSGVRPAWSPSTWAMLTQCASLFQALRAMNVSASPPPGVTASLQPGDTPASSGFPWVSVGAALLGLLIVKKVLS